MKENNIDEFMESKGQQIRKGLLSYAVLLSINNKESYSLSILKDLKKANLLVVEGTLYPLLNRLKKEGILNYKWVESKNGPPRKYYSITEKGVNLLEYLNNIYNKLSESIRNINKNNNKNYE